MQPVKVVLDTNVVISAAISTDGTPAKIFELLLEGMIINYTTQEIIDEIEEVIKRFYIDDEFRKFIVENFRDCSIIINASFNEGIVSDKADNKFINCALTVRADIISGDKHLLELGNYKGITIYNPKQFFDKMDG